MGLCLIFIFIISSFNAPEPPPVKLSKTEVGTSLSADPRRVAIEHIGGVPTDAPRRHAIAYVVRTAPGAEIG